MWRGRPRPRLHGLVRFRRTRDVFCCSGALGNNIQFSRNRGESLP